MNTQNVTLSIPENILLKVKIIAAKQGTSISGLMTHLLEETVSRDEGYQTARRRHMGILAGEIDLGTHGTLPRSREDLHN